MLMGAGSTTPWAAAHDESMLSLALMDTKAATASGAPPAWVTRASLGAGTVGPSAERDALDADGGYDNVRAWLAFDAAWLPLPEIGVGGWAAVAWRQSRPDLGGPRLQEFIGFLGPLVFAQFGSRKLQAYVGARAALAVGTLGFDRYGPAMVAPAWGGEIGLRVFFGAISVGYLQAKTRVPTALGRDYDMGGPFVWIGGCFGG
jgi:hypothetical protein